MIAKLSARDREIGAMNFSRTRPSTHLLLALLFGPLCAVTARVWANTYAPTAFTESPLAGVSVNNGTGLIMTGSGNGPISLRAALKPTDALRWTHAVTHTH